MEANVYRLRLEGISKTESQWHKHQHTCEVIYEIALDNNLSMQETRELLELAIRNL